ncbi:class I SAM-dependent methyltransferase [bacterium BD-1]|nr:class I SAM-dependent methyltransferase [Ottowia caeni]
MPRATRGSRNWFDQGGNAYLRFRPEYPPELAQFLASLAPGTTQAVDVGCGNGQLTTQLAKHFDSVLGVDPSAEQIANATEHPRVEYLRAAAEQLPVADHCAQLMAAAQAAHWFDLPRFYEEVRRVCVPHGMLALVSYGVMHLDEHLEPRFSRFYRDEIGPYWPEERKFVDSGYANLPFPFAEQSTPCLEIRKSWNLEELLGYISTWSAVHRACEAGREDISQSFAADLIELWGNSLQYREVRWPLNVRLGKL